MNVRLTARLVLMTQLIAPLTATVPAFATEDYCQSLAREEPVVFEHFQTVQRSTEWLREFYRIVTSADSILTNAGVNEVSEITNSEALAKVASVKADFVKLLNKYQVLQVAFSQMLNAQRAGPPSPSATSSNSGGGPAMAMSGDLMTSEQLSEFLFGGILKSFKETIWTGAPYVGLAVVVSTILAGVINLAEGNYQAVTARMIMGAGKGVLSTLNWLIAQSSRTSGEAAQAGSTVIQKVVGRASLSANTLRAPIVAIEKLISGSTRGNAQLLKIFWDQSNGNITVALEEVGQAAKSGGVKLGAKAFTFLAQQTPEGIEALAKLLPGTVTSTTNYIELKFGEVLLQWGKRNGNLIFSESKNIIGIFSKNSAVEKAVAGTVAEVLARAGFREMIRDARWALNAGIGKSIGFLAGPVVGAILFGLTTPGEAQAATVSDHLVQNPHLYALLPQASACRYLMSTSGEALASFMAVAPFYEAPGLVIERLKQLQGGK